MSITRQVARGSTSRLHLKPGFLTANHSSVIGSTNVFIESATCISSGRNVFCLLLLQLTYPFNFIKRVPLLPPPICRVLLISTYAPSSSSSSLPKHLDAVPAHNKSTQLRLTRRVFHAVQCILSFNSACCSVTASLKYVSLVTAGPLCFLSVFCTLFLVFGLSLLR